MAVMPEEKVRFWVLVGIGDDEGVGSDFALTRVRGDCALCLGSRVCREGAFAEARWAARCFAPSAVDKVLWLMVARRMLARGRPPKTNFPAELYCGQASWYFSNASGSLPSNYC
jgi:hypothetical protein